MMTRLCLSIVIFCAILAYCKRPIPTHIATEHPRFTKINRHGEIIKPWQGPWSCILDNQLKLLWEVKTDDESIHDGYWTYSWFNHQIGKENFGDCYFEAQRCDTEDLLKHTNQQELCGMHTWRLPTKNELKSLIQSPKRPGLPYIATDYFPHIKHGDYWTSNRSRKLPTHFKNFHEGAFSVNFHNGEVTTLPYRNAAFVILVSSIPDSYTSQLSRRETFTSKPKEKSQ